MIELRAQILEMKLPDGTIDEVYTTLEATRSKPSPVKGFRLVGEGLTSKQREERLIKIAYKLGQQSVIEERRGENNE